MLHTLFNADVHRFLYAPFDAELERALRTATLVPLAALVAWIAVRGRRLRAG